MARVTAYHQPNGMVDYNPIPFRDIAFVGEGLRKTSDEAFKIAGALDSLQVDAREPDTKRRNEILSNIEGEVSGLYDIYKSDPRQALEQARRLGMSVNKNLTRGELAAIAQSKAAEVEWAKQQKKLYEDNKIDYNTYMFNQQHAMQQGGIGQADELGNYSLFQGRRGVNQYDIQKAANDFITGYKSDKYPGGIKMVKDPTTGLVEYYDRTTNEVVKDNEVQKALANALSTNPDAMNYLGELAQTTGINPQEYLGKILDAYTNKAAFTKTTADWKLGHAEAARAKDREDAVPLNTGHYSLGTGGEEYEPKYTGRYDEQGNLLPPSEGSNYAWANAPLFSLDPDKTKSKKTASLSSAQLKMKEDRSYAKKMGIPVEKLSDKQVHDILNQAEKSRAAISHSVRGVTNEDAKGLGREVARTYSSRGMYLYKNGKAVNVEGSIKGLADQLDLNVDELNAQLKSINEKNITGKAYTIKGIPAGSTVVNLINNDGEPVQVAFSPSKQLQNAFKPLENVKEFEHSNKSEAMIEGSGDKDLYITKRINPQTLQYESYILPMKLKPGVSRPNKDISTLTEKEIEKYYVPSQVDENGQSNYYTTEEFVRSMEDFERTQSGLFGSQDLGTQKPNTTN